MNLIERSLTFEIFDFMELVDLQLKDFEYVDQEFKCKYSEFLSMDGDVEEFSRYLLRSIIGIPHEI